MIKIQWTSWNGNINIVISNIYIKMIIIIIIYDGIIIYNNLIITKQ